MWGTLYQNIVTCPYLDFLGVGFYSSMLCFIWTNVYCYSNLHSGFYVDFWFSYLCRGFWISQRWVFFFFFIFFPFFFFFFFLLSQIYHFFLFLCLMRSSRRLSFLNCICSGIFWQTIWVSKCINKLYFLQPKISLVF